MENKEELPQIWENNVQIDVLGVTGENWTGKTLFVTSIDPGNTLHYDFELSGGTYTFGQRVNVPGVMLASHQTGYRPVDVFRWWLDDIRKIKPGTWSVIAVDTISDIETGMVEHVKSLHKDYGFKTEDAFTSMGGVFWGSVKEYWKMVLSDLASRCQTFAFTSHLRAVYKNNRATSELAPKGKETLMDLCSLYLWLDRPEKNSSKPPSGTIMKSRLATTERGEGRSVVIRPLLPDRIEKCTPDEIRRYILNPPNWDNLLESEKVTKKEMTAEDRLLIEADIAADNRVAAESALSRLDRQVELREEGRMKGRKREASNDTPPAIAPKTKEICPTVPQVPKSDGGGSDGISQEQSMKLLEMASRSGVGMKALQFQIEKITGGLDPRKLPAKKAAGMFAWLENAAIEKEKKEAAVAADPKTVSMTVDDIPF